MKNNSEKFSKCENTFGSYECSCDGPLWLGSGDDCYYHNPCFSNPCPSISSVCQINIEAKDAFECVCILPRIGLVRTHMNQFYDSYFLFEQRKRF